MARAMDMETLEDMAKELLAERVHQIREEYKGNRTEEEMQTIREVDAILKKFPEEDRAWLDNHLSDLMELPEKEGTALYLSGVKDGVQMLKKLGI